MERNNKNRKIFKLEEKRITLWRNKINDLIINFTMEILQVEQSDWGSIEIQDIFKRYDLEWRNYLRKSLHQFKYINTPENRERFFKQFEELAKEMFERKTNRPVLEEAEEDISYDGVIELLGGMENMRSSLKKFKVITRSKTNKGMEAAYNKLTDEQKLELVKSHRQSLL